MPKKLNPNYYSALLYSLLVTWRWTEILRNKNITLFPMPPLGHVTIVVVFATPLKQCIHVIIVSFFQSNLNFAGNLISVASEAKEMDDVL